MRYALRWSSNRAMRRAISVGTRGRRAWRSPQNPTGAPDSRPPCPDPRRTRFRSALEGRSQSHHYATRSTPFERCFELLAFSSRAPASSPAPRPRTPMGERWRRCLAARLRAVTRGSWFEGDDMPGDCAFALPRALALRTRPCPGILLAAVGAPVTGAPSRTRPGATLSLRYRNSVRTPSYFVRIKTCNAYCRGRSGRAALRTRGVRPPGGLPRAWVRWVRDRVAEELELLVLRVAIVGGRLDVAASESTRGGRPRLPRQSVCTPLAHAARGGR